MLSGKENAMKRIITMGIACLLVVSCKKNSLEGQQLLAGNWELRQSSGGIAGTINYEPGNGNAYNFNNDKTYRFTFNGTLVYGGTYEIKESAHYGHWLLQLQYALNNQVVTQTDSVRFDGSQLIFIPAFSCCDMPTLSYARLR